MSGKSNQGRPEADNPLSKSPKETSSEQAANKAHSKFSDELAFNLPATRPTVPTDNTLPGRTNQPHGGEHHQSEQGRARERQHKDELKAERKAEKDAEKRLREHEKQLQEFMRLSKGKHEDLHWHPASKPGDFRPYNELYPKQKDTEEK